jgi:hypothetical protein
MLTTIRVDADIRATPFAAYRTAVTPLTRWPGLLLLAGIGSVIAVAGLALIRYPSNVHDHDAAAYLAALAAAVVGYLAFAAWALGSRPAGDVRGVVFGLVAGAAWATEIWAGGPARLGRPSEHAVGATFALLACAVTFAAGITAGIRARQARAALRAGLFAGTVSGVAVFCFAVLMTLTNLGVLTTRADYRREFAAAHASDMATFLIGDILAAGVAHLAINALLGLLGAAAGALVALALNRRSR